MHYIGLANITQWEVLYEPWHKLELNMSDSKVDTLSYSEVNVSYAMIIIKFGWIYMNLNLHLKFKIVYLTIKTYIKHNTIPHTIHDSMICCRKTLIKVLSAPLAQGPPVGTKMHKKALYHEVSIFWERWQVKHTHTLHGTEHQRRNKQENNTYGTYKKWWTGDDIWLVLRHMVAVAGVAEDLQGRLGENQQIMYKKFVCVDHSVFICYVLVYI